MQGERILLFLFSASLSELPSLIIQGENARILEFITLRFVARIPTITLYAVMSMNVSFYNE